jgi:hypothetical protein
VVAPGDSGEHAPYQAGSNMVHDVEAESAPARFAEGSLKFEAGTPNVPGAVGLATALEFVESYSAQPADGCPYRDRQVKFHGYHGLHDYSNGVIGCLCSFSNESHASAKSELESWQFRVVLLLIGDRARGGSDGTRSKLRTGGKPGV